MELSYLYFFGLLSETTFRLEFLRFIYDGKVIIGFFIIITFLMFFFNDRKKLIKYNIVSNIIFLILFLGMVFIERSIEYPTILHSDPFTNLEYSFNMMYKHSDKFIGIILYFSLNFVLIYKKLVLNKSD